MQQDQDWRECIPSLDEDEIPAIPSERWGQVEAELNEAYENMCFLSVLDQLHDSGVATLEVRGDMEYNDWLYHCPHRIAVEFQDKGYRVKESFNQQGCYTEFIIRRPLETTMSDDSHSK